MAKGDVNSLDCFYRKVPLVEAPKSSDYKVLVSTIGLRGIRTVSS